ncbi:MAG TPA: DUF6614 family protein [Opitutaceae bacterium]|jgi:hypothetical protein|nr:DUF6614 family protein [Opitutaceae bacterium]
MISYNVFFTPRSGIEDQRVIALAHEFLAKLKTEKKIRGYRILRVTNPASFSDLPQFQAIIDYESQQELDDSMAFMRQAQKIKEGAHGELIELVTNFKVSFTVDV